MSSFVGEGQCRSVAFWYCDEGVVIKRAFVCVLKFGITQDICGYLRTVVDRNSEVFQLSFQCDESDASDVSGDALNRDGNVDLVYMLHEVGVGNDVDRRVSV